MEENPRRLLVLSRLRRLANLYILHSFRMRYKENYALMKRQLVKPKADLYRIFLYRRVSYHSLLKFAELPSYALLWQRVMVCI